MKILVVEDDQAIGMGLTYALNQEGYESVLCETFSKGLLALQSETVDLCLLDVTLPDGSGYDLCQAAKAKGDIPVIFLTACDEEVSVVMGLDMGADDYITKPFRIRELLSRINSVMRRYGKNGDDKYRHSISDIEINTKEAKVFKKGEEIVLTALEYRLLLVFLNHKNQVLTRNQLLENIWDAAGDFVNDNTLTVYIKRLRDKLEDDPQNPRVIKTVRGMGYKAGD